MLNNTHLLCIYASMVEEKRRKNISREFDNAESEEDKSKSERHGPDHESEHESEYVSEYDFQKEKSKLEQEKDLFVKLNMVMRDIVADTKYWKYWDWFN